MTKQKMKTRKLRRILEEPKSRKGEDEDDFKNGERGSVRLREGN